MTICSTSLATRHTYGKEILGDLFEGKRTLPLVHLLANAEGDDRDLVRDYLAAAARSGRRNWFRPFAT